MNPVGEVVVRPGHGEDDGHGEGYLEDDGVGNDHDRDHHNHEHGKGHLMFGSRVPRHTLMPFKSVGEPD